MLDNSEETHLRREAACQRMEAAARAIAEKKARMLPYDEEWAALQRAIRSWAGIPLADQDQGDNQPSAEHCDGADDSPVALRDEKDGPQPRGAAGQVYS
jgi:hypothetical protein